MNGFQSLTQWQDFYNHPTGTWLGLINFMYWIGMLLSFFIAPAISNKYGRKIGLYAGIVFVAIGAAIQTAANSAPFLVARGVIDFGAGFWDTNAPLLVSEMAHPGLRSVSGALYMCGFHLGSTIAAWITLGTRELDGSWSWRIPSLLQILLPLIATPGLYLIPESPRWQVFNNEAEKAQRILADWYVGGDISHEIVTSELSNIQVAVALEQETANYSTGYMDMLKTPGNRHRTFITVTLGLWSNWVGIGVISYYFSIVLTNVGVTSTSTQLIINACMQMWNFIWAIVGRMFTSFVHKMVEEVLHVDLVIESIV